MRLGPAAAGPPLDPSADEARRWAEEELAKAIYDTGPSLLERILTWLAQLWERLLATDGAGAVLLPVLILMIAALVVAAALLLGGPLRRRRLRSVEPSMQVLDDDERGSEALRAAADRAARAGDYGTAVLERFRAIVRALDERGVLTDRQGRTAREAATQAGTAFPDQAGDLLAAGDLFDQVCYGSTLPAAGAEAWLRHLDERIDQARPVTDLPTASEGWSVAR